MPGHGRSQTKVVDCHNSKYMAKRELVALARADASGLHLASGPRADCRDNGLLLPTGDLLVELYAQPFVPSLGPQRRLDIT